MLKYAKLNNGETIAYREQGSGNQTFIMLHGNMTSSAHLDIFCAAMPETMRVITPDMRGFGASTYHQPINSLADFAADIIALVDELNIDKFILGGWSTGGGVALEIAASLPKRVEQLVLIESVGISGYPIYKKDQQGQPIVGEHLKTKEELAVDPVQVVPVTTAYANGDTATLKAIWDALIYTTNKPDDARYDIYLKDMLTQRNLVDVDYALMYFNMGHAHNGLVAGKGTIDNITAPTLIVQGDNDLVVPPAMGKSIHEALKAPVEYMSGPWGHSPFIDNADELMEKIKLFVGC